MVVAKDLKIGVMLPQWSGAMDGLTPRGQEVLALAHLAEQRGFDSLWLVDHFRSETYVDLPALGAPPPPDAYRGQQVGFWECWTLLAALAATTARAAIGTLVTNTGYRNPALLAQMAATVDELSAGRLILGLGAGDSLSEHESHGFPWAGRVGRFEEALRVLRPMLRGEAVSVAGEASGTRGAAVGLPGPRPGGPPLTIGALAGGPRMQRLVAQYADVWHCWQAFGDSWAGAYRARRAAMEAACAQHGRDPATLGRHVGVAVVLPGHTLRFPGGLPQPHAEPLTGSPAEVAAQLAAFADEGVDHLTIYAQPMTAEGLDWLAPVLAALRR